MIDLKNFIQRNSVIFTTIYIVVSLFIIGFLIYKVYTPDCETLPEEIVIQKIHREKINEINNAEDRATIDSLLYELYGFKSD